jgi:hypothetical protein
MVKLSAMNKTESYRKILQGINEYEPYLLENCGLPGPRGNLELAAAVAEEGTEQQFSKWRDLDHTVAPTGTPLEFRVFCGVLGLGKSLAKGYLDGLTALRRFASDPRWRTREAVAMALQVWGKVDWESLIVEMNLWTQGNAWEKRAAAAGLCEPALLTSQYRAERVLLLLQEMTDSLVENKPLKDESTRVLRQALGYCWSVAICAYPQTGKRMFEKNIRNTGPDIRWILRANLKKNRLMRMDKEWVEEMLELTARS